MIKKDIATRGYIALISAIIITFTLTAFVLGASFKGFARRFSVLDFEYKEISARLAKSCVNVSVLKLYRDISYEPSLGGDSINLSSNLNGDICTIISVKNDSGSFEIKTQGVYQKAYTNLMTIVERQGENFMVISSKELSEI